MTTLIVSSPHQKCPKNSPTRACDLAAGIASETFCRIVSTNKRLQYIELLGDEFRVNHDLNRKASRETPYRKRLEEVFRDLRGNQRVMVTDIHSFPNEYLVEAGDINFFKKDEIAPEIVLLKGPKDEYNGRSICQTLYNALAKYNVRCKIIYNITVNDIMNQGSEYNIPGILIEFNEKFVDHTDRLYDICRMLVKTLAGM
jgi:hypothetical protein